MYNKKGLSELAAGDRAERYNEHPGEEVCGIRETQLPD